MKGVVLAGDRRVEILDFPDPAPGPGEVVIEIKASGMCGSDLKFYRAAGGAAALGFKTSGGPVIAGHEPCGVVAAVGAGVPERQARVGMRVMQHHYRGCGVCRHCATGWMQLCVEGVAEVYGVTGHGAQSRARAGELAEATDQPSEPSQTLPGRRAQPPCAGHRSRGVQARSFRSARCLACQEKVRIAGLGR